MQDNTEFNKSLKKIFRSSVIFFICLFIGKLLVYVYRVIIARTLGAEVYGLFSLANMIVLWVSVCASLGFSEAIPRYIPIFRGKGRIDNIRFIFRHTLKYLLVSSISGGILLFLLSETIAIKIFHNTDLIIYLKILSLAVPLMVISTIFIAMLRSYEKITWYILISYIFHNIASVVFIIILLIIGFSDLAIIISYLVGYFVSLISSIIISRHTIPEIYKKDYRIDNEKKKLSKEFIRYSLPLLFSSFIGILYSWIDSFSLGYFKGPLEVGLYNAAMPIALILAITPELFMGLYFPLISEAYAKKKMPLIKELSKQVGKWVFMINVPILMLIFIFPEVFLRILFGSEFIESSTALRILVISTFILSFTGPLTRKLIQLTGKSKLIFYNVLVLAGTNFFLNSIFVPMEKIGFIDNANGINGAAIATLLSSIILATIFISEVSYHLKFIPIRKKVVSLFIIAALSGVLVLVIKSLIINTLLSSIMLSIFFLALYAILFFLTHALDDNDIMILKSIKKKFFNF